MAGQNRPPDQRQASSPPAPRSTVSARASTPIGSTTRSAAKPRKLTPSQEAWTAAERTVPDLQAAREFLQARTLIPEGSHAVTGAALISGLLHFASSAPTNELARKGLIAFAHLARAVLEEDAQTAVSDRVLEIAEDQLRLRLDHHTSHVEERIEDLASAIDKMSSGLKDCTTELRDACERVRDAERALKEAQLTSQGDAAGGFPLRGERAVTATPLTLDSAPARVRRAATLADLLQRQVLVRGATILADGGTPSATKRSGTAPGKRSRTWSKEASLHREEGQWSRRKSSQGGMSSSPHRASRWPAGCTSRRYPSDSRTRWA
ncbi:hypothetical protein C8Q78DRAFT_726420 [Trametes maxima]|nr:hypothetical protein C8Q78DRAFT_726420 [Trametes maxima]